MKQRRGTVKLVVVLVLVAFVLLPMTRETEGAFELNALEVVPRPSLLLPVQGSVVAPGFAVGNEVANGLSTTSFSTPRGKVQVNLPEDIAAGDTISGTVIAEPEGKDRKEQTRNQGELNGHDAADVPHRLRERLRRGGRKTADVLHRTVLQAGGTTLYWYSDQYYSQG